MIDALEKDAHSQHVDLGTLAYARAHGHEEIRTRNNTKNRALLAINDRLAFERQLAWIAFEKDQTVGGH